MTTSGLKCFKKQCQQKPMYFCCNPEAPACMDCSEQACSICRKARITPLKSLNKKQGSTKISRCRGCDKGLQKYHITFPCQHQFCHRCIANRICEYLRFKKWSRIALDNPQKSIKCKCQTQACTPITDFLRSYCFCCGQPIGDKRFNLKHGFQIRNTCKNRIQLDTTCEDEEKKCFLTKSQLEELFLRCEMCMGVTEDKNKCKACPGKPIKEVQSPLKKEQHLQLRDSVQIIDKKKSEKPIKKENIGLEKKQPNDIIHKAKVKSARASEIQRISVHCQKCRKRQLPNYCVKIKSKYFCWDCYEANKAKQEQAKMSKKPIKSPSCSICSKSVSENMLNHQQNGLSLCQKCVSENMLIWKKHKGGKVLEFQSAKPSQKLKIADNLHKIKSPAPAPEHPSHYNNKDHYYILGSKWDKQQEKEVYKCISCQRQYQHCITNTISAELGGYLCENCVFMSKQANNGRGYVAYQIKEGDRLKSLLYQQKPCNWSFKSFDQHLTITELCSGPEYKYSDRPILETINQGVPDQALLFIQSSRAVSCFKCGYFGKEEDWIQSQIGLVCISCLISNNDKK